MNATSAVMNQFRITRTELKKEEDKINNKVQQGRNIKNTSQKFVNNLNALSDASKKMVEKLKELESGNVKGDSGEEGMKINYFEILTERMNNELGAIVKCCAKALKLPTKGRFGSQNSELGDKAWDSISMQVKSIGQKIINESQLGGRD